MNNKEQNLPLATEIIRSLKKMIYFLIVLEILTIAGFIWYISLPVEEVTSEISQDASDVADSTVTQTIGE